MGTLSNGSEVEVYEISNGWAKIKHGYAHAYVKAQYLSEVHEQPVVTTPSPQSKMNFSFALDGGDVKWMAILIAILSGVLFAIRNIRDDDPLEGGLYIANWIIFLATTLLEIVYIVLCQGDAIWFCTPNEVGWLWTIIDFFIFGGVVYNQIMCLFNTLNDIEYNSDGVDKQWGYYSIFAGTILGIITGIWYPSASIYVLIGFAICQLVQVVIIFKSIVPSGGWGNAFLFLFVYLFGTLATFAVLACFLMMLIIVLIVLFVLAALGHSNGSSRSDGRGCRNCSHYYSDGRCDWHNTTISDYESGNHYCQYYN
jgi:hypothetical protein